MEWYHTFSSTHALSGYLINKPTLFWTALPTIGPAPPDNQWLPPSAMRKFAGTYWNAKCATRTLALHSLLGRIDEV